MLKKIFKQNVFKHLLKISIKIENGESDSAPWYVKNLDKWNQVLNKLLTKNI